MDSGLITLLAIVAGSCVMAGILLFISQAIKRLSMIEEIEKIIKENDKKLDKIIREQKKILNLKKMGF